MMNAEEGEYMDYLIHNRTQLTKQIGHHLDEILRLQNLLKVSEKAHYKTLQQLAIATKALREAHTFPQTMSLKQWCEDRLKEIDLVGASPSLVDNKM